jgi:hypothetical protein
MAIIQRYLVAFALKIASVPCGRTGRAVSTGHLLDEKQKETKTQPQTLESQKKPEEGKRM